MRLLSRFKSIQEDAVLRYRLHSRLTGRRHFYAAGEISSPQSRSLAWRWISSRVSPSPLRAARKRWLQKSALSCQRIRNALENGPARKRVGLLPQGKAPVRETAPLVAGNGIEAGIVTSGGFSPSLSRPVAMGYVDRALAAPGTLLNAQLRGRTVELVVTKLPFVPHRYVHLRKDR